MNPDSSRPDLIVVLLDCVRASALGGGNGVVPHLPRLAELRNESVVFERAETVAPWTLPSHASLFTGRYPWEHGVMGSGRLALDPNLPTCASLLRRQGYSTLALTANGMITPLLATGNSFDAYRSAAWWEKSFRWIRPERVDRGRRRIVRGLPGALSLFRSAASPRREPPPPSRFLRAGPSATTLAQSVRETRPEEISAGRWTESLNWAMLDGMNRVARVLRAPDDPRALPVAPWIERALESWLAGLPRDRPVHCFINLLDAHERYLSDAEVVSGLLGWLRYARIPQNPRLWLQGEWRSTDAQVGTLRLLYERTIRRLDSRVGEIADLLRRAGRWDNTMLVVTSDHGQAFGEHGELFHERSPSETLLHVPLWIRWPQGAEGGTVVRDRVSLTDLTPTMLTASGIEPPAGLPGIALGPHGSYHRSTPVLAMADGYPSIEHYQEHLTPALSERLSRRFSVAYVGNFKALVGLHDGGLQVFDLESDPEEATPTDTPTAPDALAAVAAARTTAARIEAARTGAVDRTLHDQLSSWGY